MFLRNRISFQDTPIGITQYCINPSVIFYSSVVYILHMYRTFRYYSGFEFKLMDLNRIKPPDQHVCSNKFAKKYVPSMATYFAFGYTY